MDRTLEGGTDAGGMVLFDPAALPDDFDSKQKTDPVSQLELLTRAGRLYWLDTHADGSYSLGVCAGDGLPVRLKPYARALDACERFQVPSGRLFFTGVEYAFRADDSLLRKHPHMGEYAELPAGTYRAEFFAFEYPEDFHEDRLRRRLPAVLFGIHRLMNTLAPIGCLAFLALLGSLFVLDWTVWVTVALPCGVSLIAPPLILSRLPAYRRADLIYKRIQKEFPGYGVLLQPAPDS
jgi:hypothetical protein